MALSPAPGSRQRVVSFVTPDVRDLLFYETRSDIHRAETPPFGTSHPDQVKYPDHIFVFARAADEAGLVYHWFYAAARSEQDRYNFSFTKADIGGNKFDAVSRVYVTLRSEFDPAIPEMGAAMPNVPEDKFVGAYVLASRQQKRIGDRELDSMFVVDEQVFVKRCQQVVIQDDDATSLRLPTISNLYYATEEVPGSGSPLKTAAELFSDTSDPFWSTAAQVVNEGRQLSCEWYEITSQQVVSTADQVQITGTDGVNGTLIRRYCTFNDYSWPGILRDDSGGPSEFLLNNDNSIVFAAVTRKSGSGNYDDINPRVVLSVAPYRGPTKMLVEEWWVAEEVPCESLPVVETLIGKEITYQGAQYNLRIEPTLHEAFAFIDTIGSSDPRFAPGAYGQAIPATDPTEWPESLIVDVDQSPFRGGYRIRVVTAYRPPEPIYVAPT